MSGSRQSLVNKQQLELSDEEEEISSIPEPNINEKLVAIYVYQMNEFLFKNS